MTTRSRHALTLLGLALVLGALTGLLEALVLWSRQQLFGQVIFASRHILWMTPLLYALIFGVLGLVAVVGGLLAPRRVTAPWVVFAGVAFGVGCLLLPVGQIHRAAAAILAAGAGVQAARFTRERPHTAGRILASVLVGSSVLAGLAGLIGYARSRSESSGVTAAVESGASQPNVLIVVWDTVRALSLSLYGHTSPTTPQLERLASESVVFDRAFSPSPWTLPGHSTLFTGRLPHEVASSWYSRLEIDAPTLSEAFRSAGRATGGFVANHHYTSYDSGLARGFDVYRDYRVSWDQFLKSSAFTQTRSGGGLVRARSIGQFWDALRESNWFVEVKRSSDRKHSDELNQQFLDWVDGLEGRPFFGFLNYFDAHAGYWSPPEFRARFAAGAEGAYEAAIAYQDDRLGTLLQELDRRGQLENTIVVMTADHGELLGEHGLQGHAHNLYLPVLHVPLLIRYPARVPSGVRVGTEATLRDVAATVLELADVEPSVPFPGESLTRYWSADSLAVGQPLLAEVEEGRNNAPDEPISRGPVRSVIGGGWQYILNGDGVEELYHIGVDPRTELDRLNDPSAAGPLADLRAELRRMLPALQPR